MALVIPKYNVGDIVRLHLYEHFDDHISIDKSYWNSIMNNDLIIENIQVGESDKNGCGVYYNFGRRSFAWREEFVYSPYVHLPDELFEV